MSETLAIVPVRAGSKGLVGKNLMPLAGVPLWQRAAEQGARMADQVIVTTDAADILAATPADRVTHLRRPTELARDDTPMAPVLLHALADVAPETRVLLLQATSPLRSDADIGAAFARFDEGGWSMVMSVTEADRGVLKWGRVEEGRFLPLGRPGDCFANRQSLPPVLRPNGAVYVFTAGAFREAGGFPSDRIGVVEMPDDRSLDIDDAAAFAEAERRLTQSARSG